MSTGGEGSHEPGPRSDPEEERQWKRRMEQQMTDILALLHAREPAPVGAQPPLPAARTEQVEPEDAEESVGVGPVQPATVVAPENPESQAYLRNRKEFMKHDISKFEGATETGVAEAWVMEVETRFEAAETEERFKVRLAQSLLIGPARKWWMSLRREEQVPTTWRQFREVFFKQYFPEVVMNQKRVEFMTLTQGDMSVRDYEQKFTELSEFAPEMVALELNKINHFLNGLSYQIRVIISSQPKVSFATTFQSALNTEAAIKTGTPGYLPIFPAGFPGVVSQGQSGVGSSAPKMSYKQRRFMKMLQKAGEKRKATEPSSQPSAPGSTVYYSAPLPSVTQGSVMGPPAVRPPVTVPTPQQSGGRGKGRGQTGPRPIGSAAPQPVETLPYRAPFICYSCGQPGHSYKRCPLRPASSVGSAVQPAQVNVVAEADPEATRRLVEGMISICGRDLHTLIDAGSTLSFISGSKVDELKLIPVRSTTALILSTVASEKLYPNLICEQCEIKIGEHEFPNDLRVMEFLEYDALLGMDWLSKYRAVIDCFRKEVIIYAPNLPEIVVYRGYNPTRVATRGREVMPWETAVLAGLVTLGEPGQEE